MKEKRSKLYKALRLCLTAAAVLVLAAAVFLAAANLIVCSAARGRIAQSAEEAADLAGTDCRAIVVLGCAVRSDKTPSPMLSERLDMAAALYRAKAAPVIYVSGDHRSDDYNEVGVMKSCLIDMGIPEEAILEDHDGLNTSRTIRHTQEAFGEGPVIFVSQKYHLYRTIFLADREGIEAFGASSDTRRYVGQFYRDIREVLARAKDLLLQ